jgi:hypothetical protein
MAQFAGSRSLDERRRRRLATESDEALAEPAAPPVVRRVTAFKSSEKSRGPGHFPLRKIISARLWKHAAVGFCGLLFAAAIAVAGWAAEAHSARLGPGFVSLFGLSTARVVRWYLATALLLSGQLATLIWWLRSQSLQDFKGRYRGWAACATIGFFAAFAVETHAVRALSDTANWLWHFDEGRQTLIGLAVLILFGLVAFRFLYCEMRDSLTSLAFLWLTCLFGSVAVVPVMCRTLPISAFSLRLFQSGSAMLAALCLFMSFLLQARHAIYVTVEPPANGPAWFVVLWKRYREKRAESKSGKSEAKTKETVALESRPKRRKRSDASKRSTEDATKEPVAVVEEKPVPKAGQQSQRAVRPERRAMRRSA